MKLALPEVRRPGSEISFEEWVALVRSRSGEYPAPVIPHSTPRTEAMPFEVHPLPFPGEHRARGPDSGILNACSVSSESCDQAQEISLWDRLGNAALLDIESDDFSWHTLSSLHHTKHTSSAEQSEDEMNKALEVTVNSGGVVFYALFNTSKSDDLSPKEAAAVIKFPSSRMATQSERLGYEFAKWLGVRTPQARVIHNSNPEWQQIKDTAEKTREVAVSNGDEVGEMTCSELLEALELSRCLFFMNYVHGTCLIDSSDAFSSRESAGNTAAALGRVLMLDLIVRNEDRLPCRQLGWRGNYANILYADRASSANMDALEEAFDSALRRYKTDIIRSLHKERRAISVNGRLSSPNSTELLSEGSEELTEASRMSTEKQATDGTKSFEFHIVAIDSGVPRRPPAGKRVKDQEQYPRVVELLLNSSEYSANLLYEITGGKLGFPAPEEADTLTTSCSCISDNDMKAVVQLFRGGFRAALRDLQGFHIFLLTLYQKLDGLLRTFLSIINRSTGELDKDEYCTSESPLNSAVCSFSSLFPACKEHVMSETHADLGDSDVQKCGYKSSSAGSRESLDSASPRAREQWSGGRYSKGSVESSRSLRLTMKLRDFNKFGKVDAELNKELEQWNETLRTDVVKLCQDNNFNTGFFEGNDNSVVDAYELKVRLEHILERTSLISDAASTERPSHITDYLYIGGALAARSIYTLQHVGVTHILCLCSNEIGQSDSQYPDHFEYRNFSVSDNDDADIADLFEEACDFIDYVEYLGGKVLVHCFEGKSRSATVVLAYLMLRKGLTLSQAWTLLKKVHRRAQPNDGFAKILLNLDKRLHGKISMEWQQKRPIMKVCPICGKNAGLSSSSLKLHLQKSHRKISSGSVDSAMTIEIQKVLDALKISRGGSVSPTQKQSQSLIDGFS